MPKIRHMQTKGLVQESGSGITFEQGQITKTLSHVTETFSLTSNGAATTTDSTVTLPAGCRVLGYKVEVVTAGSEASSITAIGHANDADAFVANAGLNNNAVGSDAGFALQESAVLGAARALRVTHQAIDDGAGNAGKVRVTALIEQVS